ncbi:hypothetical protein AgCh_010151 [Apium graveolens]
MEQENEALIAQIPDVVTRLRKLQQCNKYIEVPYWSPNELVSGYDLRSLEAKNRMEKRAVATIHELLSLTVEKKISLERIAHFRMAMDLPKKLKDFLLQH